MKTWFLSFALIFLFVSVSGISLSLSSDIVEFGCSEARVFVWVQNTGVSESSFYLSAESPQLIAFFESSSFSLKPGETGGTYLHLKASDCFRGEAIVSVNARSCASGNCVIASKRVKAFVSPCATCSQNIEGYPAYVFYSSEPSSSSLFSRMEFRSQYYPSDYSVSIKGGEACIYLKPGEFHRRRLSILNTGAAGTFDLRVSGEKSYLNAVVSPSYVSLQRAEGRDVFVDVKPSKSGKYYLYIEVIHNNLVVAEKELCYQVNDVYGARILLPSGIEVKDCEEARIFGTIRNTGTAYDLYSLSGSDFAYFSSLIDLFPGEEKAFEIVLNASKMVEGFNTLWIKAESDFVFGQGASTIVLKRCEPASITHEEIRGEDSVSIKLFISNKGSTPIKNISVSVQGIPSNWVFSAPNGLSVPGKGVLEVPVEIKPVGEEEASPEIIVYGEGRELGRVSIQKTSGKKSSITGLIIGALSHNLIWIAFLILIAFLVILLFARSHKDGREEYLEKARKLREQLS